MDSSGIEELLARLPNRRIWAARKGVGSFVTLDVGGRHEAKPGAGADTADLHLWVHLCDWELVKDGAVVLSSSSAERAFSAPLDRLVDQELLGIAVGAAPGELCITIGGGFEFRLAENLDEYESDDDMLILFPYLEEAIGYRGTDGFYRDSELN